MAFSLGTYGILKVADSGTTLRDLSPYLTDAGLKRAVEAAPVTTLGKVSEVYIPGLADGEFELRGVFDPTVDGYLAGILRVMSTYEFYPAGEPVGPTKPKYAGACMITQYAIGAGTKGALEFAAKLRLSDTCTRTVA